MINVKHLLEPVEGSDGQRLWVESIGLTRDLREWCRIDHVLPHLGPTAELSEWFEQHPEGYEFFRAKYHEALAASPYKMALQQLAKSSSRETYTLIHTGDNAAQNTATALHEFLSELGAWSTQEG